MARHRPNRRFGGGRLADPLATQPERTAETLERMMRSRVRIFLASAAHSLPASTAAEPPGWYRGRSVAPGSTAASRLVRALPWTPCLPRSAACELARHDPRRRHEVLVRKRPPRAWKGPALPRHRGRHRARAVDLGERNARTSSSSTSLCPTLTEWRSAAPSERPADSSDASHPHHRPGAAPRAAAGLEAGSDEFVASLRHRGAADPSSLAASDEATDRHLVSDEAVPALAVSNGRGPRQLHRKAPVRVADRSVEVARRWA